MKKFYFLGLALLSFCSTYSQIRRDIPALKDSYQEFSRRNETSANPNRDIIWQDDFSADSTWDIAHTGLVNSDWEIGVGLVSGGQYGTPAILSTTASNGYAMYNSDGFNNQTANYEQAYITTASPIDLSGHPNVVLEFETQYRKFTDEQTFLLISTDGTFPDLADPLVDVSTLTGVYRVWEANELTTSVSPGNPTIRRFNISSVAGNSSQVWVRLQFTGIWGYAWYVDDIKIYDQYKFDAQLTGGYTSSFNDGLEYGKIPASQVPATMGIGCTNTNLGYGTLTNVVYHSTITDGSGTSVTDLTFTTDSLSGDSIYNYAVEATLSSTAVGLYTAVFSVTNDSLEVDTTNNSVSRYFEITNDVYALDNYGVNLDTMLQAGIGTTSFVDPADAATAVNADDLVLMNYYTIANEADAYGVQVWLNTTTTVEGAEILAAVYDTTDVFADVMDAPLTVSSNYTITANDISNGYAMIPFTGPYTLDPNAYYVGVQLFSQGNTSDIRILDDVSVPQPTFASMIYLPEDAVVYSNGNAFLIRLMMSPIVSNEEVEAENTFSIYPNPSVNGRFRVTASNSAQQILQVIDPLGKVVYTSAFASSADVQLKDVAAGVYTVRLYNSKSVVTKQISIQ